MPYKWHPPKRFLAYRGVRIFHAYKDELSDVPLDFWYSTADCESPGSAYEFDVRELPGFRGPHDRFDEAEHKRVMRDAIAAGVLLNETPLNEHLDDQASDVTLD